MSLLLALRDRAAEFELASALGGTAEAIGLSATVGSGVIDPGQTKSCASVDIGLR